MLIERLRLTGPNMPPVTMLFDNLLAGSVVVASVEAEILWLLLGRLRTLDHYRLNGFFQ